MTRRFILALLLATSTLLAGCGGSDDSSGSGDDGTSAGEVVDVLASLDNLPVTFEGELLGAVDEDGEPSDSGYRSLLVNGVGFMVIVDDALLSSAGIPADFQEVRVRATIGHTEGEGNFVVTKLEKL